MVTSLLFGIHCHQPVGNFDEVVYEAIEKSYKPFFQTLSKYPDFKVSVHFSGWLFEFIQKNDSELFTLMQSLKKQIEFFTGGFYEPVLASIPSCDRIAQIKKLNNFIKKHFSQTPKGLWLTERVWDNSIISDLKQCDIEYVIVDDHHLLCSGQNKNNTFGYFTTEDSGETLGIFPINQELRYAIPFYDLETTNNLLHEFKEIDGKNAAIIFDDGEKFGIWPNTYEAVYEKKWLEDFIEQTLKDESISVDTFQEFFQKNNPIDLVYLPTTSYEEMGLWSLSFNEANIVEELLHANPDNSHMIKGGTWKNFLNKYSESNWIHKRSLELSKKQTTSTKYKDALYKTQCNDVLWHGVFGGIYLPSLRDNAYKYIIECETFNDKNKETLDIDLNGFNEYKFIHKNLLTIISSKNGGQIFELDIFDKQFNFQNCMTRYHELYHKNIEIKEEEEQEELDTTKEETISTIHNNKLTLSKDEETIYDWYIKRSSIDHIVPNISQEEFEKNSFKELGDFANQPYDVTSNTKSNLKLQRDGGIYLDEKYDTKIVKSYGFIQNGINLNLQIETNYDKELTYFNEWNLHFANYSNIKINNSTVDFNIDTISLNTNELKIFDPYTNKTLSFTFDEKITIYATPIKTVTQSEKGLDVTIQGISFGFVYTFNQTLNGTIKFTIE